MKKYIKLTIITFFFGILFISNNLFAEVTFQEFSVSASLNQNCKLSGTFSFSIPSTQTTITSGHIIFLKIDKLNTEGQIIQNNEDTVVNNIPVNGQDISSNFNSSGQVFSGQGVYQFTMIEKNSEGQVVSQSQTISQTLNSSSSSCDNGEAVGSDNNQSSSSSSNSNTGSTSFSIDIENPISVNSIPQLIQKVLEFLIKIGIPLLVVMIVYSGFLYLFARGNPGKIGSAHTMLKYTLIGGAILLASWAIAELIHSTLIDITALIIQYFV